MFQDPTSGHTHLNLERMLATLSQGKMEASGARGWSKEEVWSPYFYAPVKRVQYDSDEERGDQELHLKDLKALRQIKTYFQDAPRVASTPVTLGPLRKGQYVAPIKFLCHRKHGDFAANPEFYFVYQGYDAMLKNHQQVLTAFCSLMDMDRMGKHKVGALTEIPIGGVFGLRLPEHKYMRVRITALNGRTKVLTYWAVDEGKVGTCTTKDLLHVNADCLRLTMLVVPGMFEKVPTPEQLQRFEAGKFCVGIVTQPRRYCDFGPRKIILS